MYVGAAVAVLVMGLVILILIAGKKLYWYCRKLIGLDSSDNTAFSMNRDEQGIEEHFQQLNLARLTALDLLPPSLLPPLPEYADCVGVGGEPPAIEASYRPGEDGIDSTARRLRRPTLGRVWKAIHQLSYNVFHSTPSVGTESHPTEAPPPYVTQQVPSCSTDVVEDEIAVSLSNEAESPYRPGPTDACTANANIVVCDGVR